MNIVLDFSTAGEIFIYANYANIYLLMNFTKFLKNSWLTIKDLL